MKISVTYLFALFFFVTFCITFHNVFVADALAQYIPSGATIKKDLKNNVKSFSDDLGGDFQQISGSNQAKRANQDIQGIIPKEAQTNFPDGGRTRTSYSANIEPVQPLIGDDMQNFQGSSNLQFFLCIRVLPHLHHACAYSTHGHRVYAEYLGP